MTSGSTIDAAALTAIDVHVHLEAPRRHGGRRGRDEVLRRQRRRARRRGAGGSIPVAQDGCVVFAVDERLSGGRASPNETVLELAEANPDVVIPFASVDPTRG